MTAHKYKNTYMALFAMLALIFFVQSFYLVAEKYMERSAFKKMTTRIELATKIADILHQTQKERGVSVGYTESHGRVFGSELMVQQGHTDYAMEALRRFLTQHRSCMNGATRGQIEAALKASSLLERQREYIRAFHVSSDNILRFYSTINQRLLHAIVTISKNAILKSSYNDLISYNDFMYLKEYAGIERAIGFEIASSADLSRTQKRKFASLIEKQKVYESLFVQYARRDFVRRYQSVLKQRSYLEIKKIRTQIIAGTPKTIAAIDPKFWFDQSTRYIDGLQNIHAALSTFIMQSLNSKLLGIQRVLLWYILAALVFSILFFSIIYILVKMIENEKKMKKMIDKYIIISRTDPHGVITDVSEAFCSISGYTREELIGKPHSIVRDPAMPAERFRDMWRTIRSGQRWEGRLRNQTKEKGFYWVHAVIEPIFNRRGRIVSYTAIRQNITNAVKLDELNATLESRIRDEVAKNQQKDQQLILQSRHAQMGEMISMIAHQWRQPLSAISSLSGALELKATLDNLGREEAAKHASRITEYAQHLSRTINDFRDFFRPNKTVEHTTYPELVDKVLSIVDASAQTEALAIDVVHTHSVDLYTYPSEVKQVIVNLIKNAEDVLRERATANPFIRIVSDGPVLTIEDNAGGIPEPVMEKIFDPYFSTKSKKDGTGLGLYMAKTIIEEHCRGALTVTNTEHGACFSIRLSDVRTDTDTPSKTSPKETDG